MRDIGWSPGYEHAAGALGRDIPGRELTSRVQASLERLAHMPARCERCARGRPIGLVGDGSGVGTTAVCRACLDSSDPGRHRARLQRDQTAERERLLLFAEAESWCQRDRPISLGVSNSRLIGYVSIFGEPRRCSDGSQEEIAPGAFAQAIRRGGITLQVNHDPRRIIARQGDGSLNLLEDDRGLRLEADVADHQVLAQAARGVLRGGSFQGRMDVRLSAPPLRHGTVQQVDLVEVSVLTGSKRPAYRGTWIGLDTDANRRRAWQCQHDAVDRLITDAEVAC